LPQVVSKELLPGLQHVRIPSFEYRLWSGKPTALLQLWNIVARGSFTVCDGAHWLDVMKDIGTKCCTTLWSFPC